MTRRYVLLPALLVWAIGLAGCPDGTSTGPDPNADADPDAGGSHDGPVFDVSPGGDVDAAPDTPLDDVLTDAGTDPDTRGELDVSPDQAGDTGSDTSPLVTGPQSYSPVAAGGHLTSAGYELYLRVGAPQPMGETASPSTRVRFALPAPITP